MKRKKQFTRQQPTMRNVILAIPFLAQKSNQKTWRKLTRTIGLWVLDGLWCCSRTIKICSFGSQVPPECCSNIDFRRWMCGFATGVGGWEGGFLICRSDRMKESAAVGGFVEGYEI